MRLRRALYGALAWTVVVGALGGGCDGCKKSGGGGTAGGAGGGAATAATEGKPVGMVDPFAAPTGDAAKLIETARSR